LIDVRDAMQAYWDAAVYCEYGEAYNIGGLTTISVGEFLEMLKGSSTVPISSRVDPQLLRPVDVTLQIPCTDKFTQLTGWKPQYDFKESVEYLLFYWRKEVLKEVAEDDI
jgi:nucleoside-diphosphate-sugar epimerase